MDIVEKSLHNLGLSEHERLVYLALLRNGFSRASEVAKACSLPRQTVYSILEKLVVEEFIEQSDKRGVKQFFADPNKLLTLIDRRRQNLESDKRVLEKDLTRLLSTQTKSSFFPKIQYYEGRNGLMRLFKNILDQYKKGESKSFRGYGVNKMKDALGEFLFDFVRQRDEYGVQTRLFIGQGPDDLGVEKNAYGRSVKRLQIKPQNAGLYIVGEKIYLFSYPDQVGIMIQNTNIADLLQTIFDDHWTKY